MFKSRKISLTQKIIRAFVAAAVVMSAHTTTAYAALKIVPDTETCSNEKYRTEHPTKCNFWVNTATPVAGGIAIIGGALALIGGASSGGGTHSSAPSSANVPVYIQPTNPNQPRFVGTDIDSAQLASVMSSREYAKNINQFNDIQAAYSLARGFTGAGSNIAVLDTGWHGKSVAKLAGDTIAPDANVTMYNVANDNMEFFTYKEIGNIIGTITDANIYNSSWNMQMRASQLHTRKQLEMITDSVFVNQMVTAAQRDAIFVWAAGNEYDKSGSGALSAMPNVVPELRGHFINVVAWDSATGALAEYSNACGNTMEYCITAPGSDLTAGYLTVSGTSFATPIVSAAVAVLRQAYPYMTSPEITELLFETAHDLGAAGVDEIYGHGMVDLERATRPVGTPVIAVENAAPQELRTAHISGIIAHNIESAGIKLAYFDKYGRPFETKLSDNISIKNPSRAFERLRADADIIAVQSGAMEFGFKTSDLVYGDGFMNMTQKNIISFIGTNNHFTVGNVHLYNQSRFGFSAPKAIDNSIVSDYSGIYTASVSFGAEFKDWKLGIGIPDTIISGTMNLRLPTDRAANGQIIYHDYTIDMSGRPAIEYTIGYKSITASFIDNPYGNDEFFVMTKHSFRF